MLKPTLDAETYERLLNALCGRLRDVVFGAQVYLVSAEKACVCTCRIFARSSETYRHACMRCGNPVWRERSPGIVQQILADYPVVQDERALIYGRYRMHEEKKILGEKLRKAREKAGLHQWQLGYMVCGSDKKTCQALISQFERGVYAPSAKTMARLREILDLDEGSQSDMPQNRSTIKI